VSTKTELLDALEALVRQRPNLSAEDCGGLSGRREAERAVGRDRTDALAMIAAARADGEVKESDIAVALSGSQPLRAGAGVFEVDGKPDQWAMKYRAATCQTLAHALAIAWRQVAGRKLQTYAGSKMNRGTAKRWFS
jgi:hypothetical protein